MKTRCHRSIRISMTFVAVLFILTAALPAAPTLNPGTVQVKGAHYQGHKIYDRTGTVVGDVSNIRGWIPLPPGE